MKLLLIKNDYDCTLFHSFEEGSKEKAQAKWNDLIKNTQFNDKADVPIKIFEFYGYEIRRYCPSDEDRYEIVTLDEFWEDNKR